MKRLNYLVNGLVALALVVSFSQCANNANQQTASNAAPANGVSGLKIAYVEVDTLLSKYNFLELKSNILLRLNASCPI